MKRISDSNISTILGVIKGRKPDETYPVEHELLESLLTEVQEFRFSANMENSGIKRLRRLMLEGRCPIGASGFIVDSAADEIEHLRSALQTIIDLGVTAKGAVVIAETALRK